jgi:type II secretory ATPase GspE/PulE/Tfp pilus assembly ATPase PilB-like protein
MTDPFDTKAEDEKLRGFRAEEEEDLAQLLSQKYGMQYADLRASPVDMEALRLIPEARAKAAEALAFNKEAKNLSIALLNPSNPALTELMKQLEGEGFELEQFLVSKQSFDKAFGRYKELSFAAASKPGVFTIRGTDIATLKATLTGIPALGSFLASTIADKKSAAEVSELIDGIMTAAYVMKVSDIHIEPEESAIRLRFRLDGVLQDVFSFSPEVYRFLNSRLKLLSGMKLNVRDRAQDGRFTVEVGGTELEIRASLIPGNYGESFVMRLLDPASIKVGLDTLGIHPKLLAKLEEEIKRPNGMLLTTGPTGSGKTTTLYAFLRKIHTPDIKIITIEDPIEYHLEGIVQTQAEKEYTFAEGLRSIVRQDPDVIMIGEIRDTETVGIAIQAALTGHFVYSTLHTNDAAGTFPRLVDLGADPKEFASAISVSMAQRLVRTLDPEAKKEIPLEGKDKELVEKILDSIVDKSLIPEKRDTVWVPDPKVEGAMGYKGRTGLYEAIFMDDELGNFLRDNPSVSDIRKNVARQGFLTMAQDGVLKALAGITSLDEVFSVADVPRD